MSMKTRNYHLGLAWLRILACLSVVCLHTFGRSGDYQSPVSYLIWYGGTFAIPVFFALSGYFTLGRNLSWKQIFLKILGTVLLILSWSVLISIYQMIKTHTVVNPLADFVLSFMQAGHLPRFWYFWAWIILLLLTPFIELFYNSQRCSVVFVKALLCCCLTSYVINLVYIIRGGIRSILIMPFLNSDRHIRYGFS
jgi:surface polysaccharide O-acyltransferase-like enzyme